MEETANPQRSTNHSPDPQGLPKFTAKPTPINGRRWTREKLTIKPAKLS